MLLGVKELAGLKQLAGEALTQKLRAAAGCAMQDQRRVSHQPGFIAAGRAERAIMQAQRRHDLAVIEGKVANCEIARSRVHLRLAPALWTERRQTVASDESAVLSQHHKVKSALCVQVRFGRAQAGITRQV